MNKKDHRAELINGIYGQMKMILDPPEQDVSGNSFCIRGKNKNGVINMDSQAMKMHITEHMEYPATKKQIIEACNNMADVSEADKAWFSKTLPDKKYNRADEVIKALKL